MPAKKTSISTAEKRVIKAEIKTLKRAVRKITSDSVIEAKRIDRAREELDRQYLRVSKSYDRETKSACRRISILEGRL